MDNFAVVFLAFLPFCLGAATPDPIAKLCKAGDPNLKECWLKSGNEIGAYVINGVPSHNIPPTSPLYVPKHEIKTPTYSAEFTNLIYNGTSTYTITDAVVHPTNNAAILKLFIEDLKLESDVTSKGNLGGIPLDGSGKIKIDFVNVTYDVKFEWESFAINGVKYHNVFGDVSNIDYGVVELKSFDVVKDVETLEALKKKFHELKAATYLHVLEQSFIKHILRYVLRAYNAVPAE